MVVHDIYCSCCFQVHWAQQQHEKRRKKRDYAVPTAAASTFTQYLSAIAPQAAPHGRQRYRAATNTFPDPLYKEQWYLVSTCMLFACCYRLERLN